MDTATIEIPQAKAREAVKNYRAMVRERHIAEDDLILRGYKAIARGQTVISLSETIRRGGFGETGHPKLAISRADRRITASKFEWISGPSGNTRSLVFWWDGGFWPGVRDTTYLGDWGLRLSSVTGETTKALQAIVPVIPPELRPASLSAFHILFEAEWKEIPAPPGKDPALLKHIGGDLWALVAMWDLTDLERLVLQGRR